VQEFDLTAHANRRDLPISSAGSNRRRRVARPRPRKITPWFEEQIAAAGILKIKVIQPEPGKMVEA